MNKTKTDRELWSEPQLSSGIFTYSILMGGYRDDFADGLRGFAAAWFACYEDEDNLPAWFAQALKDAEEIGLDDLNLPTDDWWELLQMDPDVLRQKLSTQEVAA